MIQYLVVLLSDNSVPYCCYPEISRPTKWISIEDLKKARLFAMKENLTIQVVYPKEQVPADYLEIIQNTKHVDIVPVGCDRTGDIYVGQSCQEIEEKACDKDAVHVLRTDKNSLFSNASRIANILSKVSALNVILTDIPFFTDADFDAYRIFLSELERQVLSNDTLQEKRFNILLDRIRLSTMNNCNAGVEQITLAPDGKFYPCPAFYFDAEPPIGSLDEGVAIPNQQLYRLDHSLLCMHCDAYQCRRCIWLNKKQTLEVNTPSHEQCVVSHLERNASRNLLEELKGKNDIWKAIEIPQLDYLDPFEKREDYIYHKP